MQLPKYSNPLTKIMTDTSPESNFKPQVTSIPSSMEFLLPSMYIQSDLGFRIFPQW